MTYEELKKFANQLQEKLENGEVEKATHQINFMVGIITRNFTTKFKVYFMADKTKYIVFQDEENFQGIITTFREDKLQKIEVIKAVIPLEFIPNPR